MEWCMREREGAFKFAPRECPDYSACPDLFTIKLHHDGQFNEYMTVYGGGKVDYFDACDVDKLSLLEIIEMWKECADDKGGGPSLWYKHPEEAIDTALMPLDTDFDVIEMTKLVPMTWIVDVFVTLTKPVLVENMPICCTPLKPTPDQITIIDDDEEVDSDEVLRAERELVDSILEGEGLCKTFSDVEREKEQDKARQRKKRKTHKKRGSSNAGPSTDPVDEFAEVEVGSWEDDRSNQDLSDIETVFEEYVQPQAFNEEHMRDEVGGSGNERENTGPQTDPIENETDNNVNNEGAEEEANKMDDIDSEAEGFPDSIDGDSEDERMAVVSDDDVDAQFPEFNDRSDMVRPQFQLGMIFSGGAVLRHAIRILAILERRPIRRTPNMGSKIQFTCKPPCEWRIYASKCQKSDNFQIKSYVTEHTCQETYHQEQISSDWIAWRYENEIRMNVNWEVDALHVKVVNDLRCNVEKCMVYRAKDIALKRIKGSHEEQFGQLWDYLNEVKRVMPQSSCYLECEDKEPGQERGRFKRVYICLSPLRMGFLEGCRPIIGLDGCHLKGPYGGQMLTAVGVDGNDGMYPLAWAIVDVENTENWAWFISCLKKDINMENSGSWTFISDKQKGLINAMQDLCPDSEHRFCVMHLYRNMWKDHKGLVLRNLLWSAARSTTRYHFDKNMEEMKKTNKKCYQWLNEKPMHHWSRAGFRCLPKCDMFVNNHSESFNSAIKKYRHLPIITLLKEIHNGVMTRIVVRRDKILQKGGIWCAKALEKLDTARTKAGNCHARWSGGPTFSVTVMDGGFELVVNLHEKSCACRKWQLTGIPCFHAVACYNSKERNAEEGLDSYYQVQKLVATYSHYVEPINGMEFWERTPYPKPLPPNVKLAPGRPKKKRSRTNDVTEDGVHLKMTKGTVRCGCCKELGHNKKSCPAKANDDIENTAAEGANTGGSQPPETTVLGPSQPQQSQTQTPVAANATTSTSGGAKKGRGRKKKVEGKGNEAMLEPLSKEKRKELLSPST